MKKWIFFLVVGISLLLFSTGAAGKDGVRCDGELMSPGDICEYTDRTGDVTSRETYDEVKAGNEAAHRTFVMWGRWALLGGGLALTALGIWGIVRERRRRKAAGPTTADRHLQQQAVVATGAPAPHAPAGAPTPHAPAQQHAPAQHAPAQHAPTQQQYAPPPQQFAPRQQFPPPGYPPRPTGNPAPPRGKPEDFGPGAGEEDVTQRLR
jgi:hypothetical protein